MHILSIEAHGSNLYDLVGPSFSASFDVEPDVLAKTVWINDRWFSENGFDVANDQIRHSVEQQLKATFGVYTSLKGGGHKLWADRYGRAGGAIHGGSGRGGLLGPFFAKGIGRTPLASARADRVHSHGLLPLSEAFVEVIAEKACNRYLPLGAVPIIAIIALNSHVLDSDGFECRAGVLVRLSCLRPAHLERSILFGTSGYIGSDQELDARRVKEAWDFFIRMPIKRHSRCLAGDKVGEVVDSAAYQAGAAAVTRIWHGRFSSSNIAINGSLLDFGSFRSSPTWHRSFGGPRNIFFDQRSDLLQLARSLRLHGRIYGPSNAEKLSGEDRRLVDRAWENGFSDVITQSLLQFVPETDLNTIVELLRNEYAFQQKIARDLGGESGHTDEGWLIRSSAHPRSVGFQNYVLNDQNFTSRELRLILGGLPKAKCDLALAQLLKLLAPATCLYYHRLRRRAFAISKVALKEGSTSRFVGSLLNS